MEHLRKLIDLAQNTSVKCFRYKWINKSNKYEHKNQKAFHHLVTFTLIILTGGSDSQSLPHHWSSDSLSQLAETAKLAKNSERSDILLSFLRPGHLYQVRLPYCRLH